MTRPSPIAGQLGTFGATMTEAFGVQVAARFSHPEEEHRAVRTTGGLFDLSHRGLIQITGADRKTWFRGQCTNEVIALPTGAGNHTCIVNRLGRLVTDAVLSVTEDALWLEMNADRVAPAIEHLEKYHITEKVEVKDRTKDFGLLGLHGPAVGKVLASVGGQDVPEATEYRFAEKQVAGVTVRVQRCDHTGEPGYTIVVPSMVHAAAFGMLAQFGMVHGVRPCGFEALRSLRVEAGRPVFGPDATDQHLPLECGLDHTVSYTKGCYLGQEVIARVSTLGEASRSLVGLRLQGEATPAVGSPVTRDGAEVGRLGTAVLAPTVGGVIALAVIKKEHRAPGTEVAVTPAAGGATIPATVRALPFYRRG